jgi:UV DNA damage endonuclease
MNNYYLANIYKACLNTYLRQSNPPVFSSRTCRIASILEHRHPLKDPSQPKHAAKNRPDKNKPADIALGQKWIESLGLANARDIIKMVRWNHKYGIKFMRLSSEMFPFASHKEYGYKLAPFAAETLAEAGKVIGELGHRVTTHPGQFTQLGSPRKQVIDNSIRDLEYHDEMLSLLNLPPQQDRDAVIILHMGGMFGSKEETLARFRENYAKLSSSIKNRLVLENDDMAWSVHDLLPICQELNIPLVLDFHHHNIVFDASKLREGTKDIMELFPVIRDTWTRKGITQKMHYSEPTFSAITPMQRRKHSPRVMTLPPCPNDMDLMIEAKDKEQAVFELMRVFKLPGFEKFNNIVPYVRSDENKPESRRKKKASPKRKRTNKADEVIEELEEGEHERSTLIPEEEIGMGGPDNRVYWPPGMEEWLRPKKRQAKAKDADEEGRPKTPRKRKDVENQVEPTQPIQNDGTLSSAGKTQRTPRKRKRQDVVPTPSASDTEGLVDEDDQDVSMMTAKTLRKSKKSGRVNYAEAEQSELDRS